MIYDPRIEAWRVKDFGSGVILPVIASVTPGLPYGAFRIPFKDKSLLTVVSSLDDGEWEHVSVSLRHCAPSWEELLFIKSIFWDPEEEVIQILPRKSEYVNLQKNTHHLWRHISGDRTEFFRRNKK